MLDVALGLWTADAKRHGLRSEEDTPRRGAIHGKVEYPWEEAVELRRRVPHRRDD